MKKIKKIISSIFLGTIFATPIFSNSNNLTVALEPCFGIRNAVFYEYVYEKNSQTGQSYHLSQLDWGLENSFYIGINADASLHNFHLNAGFKAFIPNSRGLLTDSDWLQDAGYKTGNSSIKTNYSEHTNDFSLGLNFDLFASGEFSIGKYFSIYPTLGFSYEKYDFDGLNGTAWYGNPKGNNSLSYYSYNDVYNRKVGNFSGRVISLSRQDYYYWLGVKTKFKTPDNRWIFTLDLFASPITLIDAYDTHWINNGGRPTYYADKSEGFFSSFRGTTSALFMFNKTAGIKFLLNGLITTEIKGEEYIKYSENEKFRKHANTVIGAGSKYFDLQLSAFIQF